MSQYQGFNERYLATLGGEVQVLEEALVTGNGIASWEMYKAMVGKRGGLLIAINEFRHLNAQLQEQAHGKD